jgi:hypothetical protein
MRISQNDFSQLKKRVKANCYILNIMTRSAVRCITENTSESRPMNSPTSVRSLVSLSRKCGCSSDDGHQQDQQDQQEVVDDEDEYFEILYIRGIPGCKIRSFADFSFGASSDHSRFLAKMIISTTSLGYFGFDHDHEGQELKVEELKRRKNKVMTRKVMKSRRGGR